MYEKHLQAEYAALKNEARSYRESIQGQPSTAREARRRHWSLAQLATKVTTRDLTDWANRLPRSVRRAAWRESMRAAGLLGRGMS